MNEHNIFLVVTLMIFTIVKGYPTYPNLIPNGNRVPHPCKPNYIWYGVGHKNSKGGGERNVFGEAFKRHGREWNQCLCKEDSDGDGRTNGEELGDPDCIWSVGKIPARTTRITHPGICDPFEDAKCTRNNSWVDCSSADFKCDGFNEPDVSHFTLSFPETKVPAKETTYVCMAFNLTQYLPPGESHLIGNTPSLDNKQVMHHTLIFACPDENAEKVLQNFSTPVQCGMATRLCRSLIGTWTIGVDGSCVYKNMGFPLGQNGFSTVLMQFHWNNPEIRSDYTDASGMTLYVKANKRTYDAGVWMIGPPLVFIPPGFQRYSNFGGCSSACTRLMLPHNIYITRIAPHMHYLGLAFKFQQYRNGIKIYELEYQRYFYDDPPAEKLDNPLELRPSDELKIECVFQSIDKETFTYFGESTQEEMCFAFIRYYPYNESIGVCLTNDGYGYCQNKRYPEPFNERGGTSGCSLTDFTDLATRESATLAMSCDSEGKICRTFCKNALSKITSHPCWTGKARSILMSVFYRSKTGIQLLKYISSCEERPVIVDGGSGQSSVCNIKPPISSGHKEILNLIVPGLMLLLISLMLSA